MEDKSKQPEYPCFVLSNEDNDVLMFSPLPNDLINTLDGAVIEKYWINNVLVDCKGDVYKIVGIEKLAWWRRFVPIIIVAKAKIVVQYTGKSVTLEVLRAHMLSRFDALDWENSDVQEVRDMFREKMVKAQNFKELLS